MATAARGWSLRYGGAARTRPGREVRRSVRRESGAGMVHAPLGGGDDARSVMPGRADVPEEALSAHAPSDLFELFGVDAGASDGDVKNAYRRLQKLCHPDVAGDDAAAMAALLNAAFPLVSSAAFRTEYEKMRVELRRGGAVGFDGRPKSKWCPEDDSRGDAIFVDECSCIGCTLCVSQAPNTFVVEPLHGRARVDAQWADTDDDIEEAIAVCPVDAIHRVWRAELALLEFTMTACTREDIAIVRRRLSGNMGSPSAENCPFERAETFLKYRSRASARDADVSSSARARSARELSQHAGAIAGAWLALPATVRAQGWPGRAGSCAAGTFFV